MNVRNIWTSLIYIELFLMMWATGYYMGAKILLCLIICLVGIYKEKGVLKASHDVWTWLGVYITSNLFFVFLSVIYSNPGVTERLNVDIVEPLIFTVIIASIRVADFEHIKKSFVYIPFFLSVYVVFSFLSINGLVPVGMDRIPFLQSDIGGVLPFGLMKPSLPFIPWLYFLIPANVICFFYRHLESNRRMRRIISLTFILNIFAVITIMKSALLIVYAIAVAGSFIASRVAQNRLTISGRKILKFTGLIILSIIILTTTGLADFIDNTLLLKVKVSLGVVDYINLYGVVDTGSEERIEQIRDLMSTWSMNPILGWGSGADSLGVKRSAVPGSYEMVYFAKLMQRGLVGMIIYMVLFGWIYKELYAIAKKGVYKLESLYVMAGLTGILIANCTNPYIEAFDKLIMIFLPLLIINVENQKNKVLF